MDYISLDDENSNLIEELSYEIFTEKFYNQEEDKIEQDLLQEKINKIMYIIENLLTESEASIIKLYFYNGLDQYILASFLKVAQSNINYKIKRVINKIKFLYKYIKIFNNNVLRDIIDLFYLDYSQKNDKATEKIKDIINLYFKYFSSEKISEITGNSYFYIRDLIKVFFDFINNNLDNFEENIFAEITKKDLSEFFVLISLKKNKILKCVD